MRACFASDGQVLLSPGEYNFMFLLCDGYSRSQIAARTNVQEASLRTFAMRVKRKLRCKTTVEAAVRFKTFYLPTYGHRYTHRLL